MSKKTEEKAESGVVILSKLSTATMGANHSAGKEGRSLIGRIFGVASGIKEATDPRTKEPMYGLKGQFRGVNPAKPNVQYQSGVAWLPGGVHEMLVDAVIGDGVLDEKGRPVYSEVKFAVDVYSKPASSPAGYQFEVIPLIDAREADMMSELAAELPPLALPGN